MTEVRAFAPGTVANVSCGFDIFGFALDSPGDTVVARRRDEPGVGLAAIHGDGGRIPREPERNTASVAAAYLLKEAGVEAGVELELLKGMPLSSGLGSSAASAVAAVVAVNELLGTDLSPERLLRCAVEGERAATGVPHADNAGPCLVGGFLIVRGPGESTDFRSIPVPEELHCAVLHPHIAVETRGARAVLPEAIPLADAITQWGNVGSLIVGLYESDYDLIARSVRDVVAEPVRSGQVPGFADVTAAAREAGALACGLSGSGPSVFALCRGRATAEAAAAAMQQTFDAQGLADSHAWASPAGAPGARVVDA